MNSNEFWEGYHSFKKRLSVEACPYRFEPISKRDWLAGFRKAQSEAQ